VSAAAHPIRPAVLPCRAFTRRRRVGLVYAVPLPPTDGRLSAPRERAELSLDRACGCVLVVAAEAYPRVACTRWIGENPCSRAWVVWACRNQCGLTPARSPTWRAYVTEAVASGAAALADGGALDRSTARPPRLCAASSPAPTRSLTPCPRGACSTGIWGRSTSGWIPRRCVSPA
jgi:hypothetical protein